MITKRKIFTIIDIVIALLADYWCFWLMFYFSATIDGPICIRGEYAIWERNYLVPAQVFGIPIIATVISIVLYQKLRKKELIGKKYIALVWFNIVPLYLIFICQVINFVNYYDVIY